MELLLQMIKEYQELNIRSSDCKNCLPGKARRANATPHSKDKHIGEERPFSVIYSDVCQVIDDEQCKFYKAPKYLITFRCVLTGYTQIYGMKLESEIYKNKIYQFIKWVKTQFHLRRYKVTTFFFDNGGEYIPNDVKLILTEYGIYMCLCACVCKNILNYIRIAS